MGERDFAPLSAGCVRALNDKLYEKRKNAALEIERMVKEFSAQNNTLQIKRLIRVLGHDFVMSQNANSRKGGLIGLAATSIAMGKESSTYVSELVKPVFACFYDSDSRVRYFACESLYNIVKVARGSVLPYFNEIFDGLSRLAADPDQNVRNGADVLDRLMKDVVTESSSFDLESFLPLLRERIYSRNQFARQFIVSWVSLLDAVPDIDMLVYLPEILDGFFHILGDNNTEIRKMCEASLGEFLRGISKTPTKVNYSGMVNILIAHSQSPDDVIKYTAITWLKEFVHISGRTMLPFAAGIITAVLPCLSYSDNGRKSIREASRAVNSSLMRLVGPEDDGEFTNKDGDSKEASEKSDDDKNEAETDKDVMAVVNHILDSNNKNDAIDYNTNTITLDVSSMVEVLTRQLLHESMQTRIAALRWIYHLHIKTPNKIFEHVDELFPLLLKTLSDPSDEVVLLDLEVLAEISSSPAGQRQAPSGDAALTIPSPVKHAVESSHSMNGYFTKFMISLLDLFSTDRQLLEDRGSFIIRQLCLLLNAEDIYRCCSEILLHEEDMKFASHMIQTLSAILLTSTELFELRTQLKDLKTEESCALFRCLYNSWCHNPVATVALCLLTQNYQHTCSLLQMFGDLEVTVEFLTEIDKLVQLIESPIFTYLRLQLLDVQHNQHLIKSLYGLLMLLPQSDAFQTLRHRLECVPHFHFPPFDNSQTVEVVIDHRLASKSIDFKQLLTHFKDIQSKHRASRRLPRTLDT